MHKAWKVKFVTKLYIMVLPCKSRGIYSYLKTSFQLRRTLV